MCVQVGERKFHCNGHLMQECVVCVARCASMNVDLFSCGESEKGWRRSEVGGGAVRERETKGTHTVLREAGDDLSLSLSLLCVCR